MSAEELANFSLDASLGGHSDVLQCKAIYRIYGEKAHDVVEGMKKNPQLGISVVLKRLKAKQEEWQEAQRSFNKTWRDQLEKYVWHFLLDFYSRASHYVCLAVPWTMSGSSRDNTA